MTTPVRTPDGYHAMSHKHKKLAQHELHRKPKQPERESKKHVSRSMIYCHTLVNASNEVAV